MEYKQVLISPIGTLTKNDTSAISHFGSLFSHNELKVEYNKDGVYLFLRQIRHSDFHRVAFRVGKEFQTDILQVIVDKVDEIGSYGTRSGKRNYVDFNKERKVQGRKQKEEKRGRFFYANDNTFSQESHILPKKYENSIICDDSEKFLKKIPDNSIDLIFTSPPYNFGLDYDANQDDIFWKEYFDKLFAIFDQCVRILKYGGRIIINIQPLFSDYIPSHHIVSNYFIGKKMIWKGEILWEKNNYNCKYTAWGSWKSPSNPYLKYTWEFLEIFSKGSLKKEGSSENADISPDEFKKWVVAKWSIAPEREMKKWKHPAMFPEKLVERVLKLFSFRGDVVLDPFNGVGTTTAVAKKLERKYIGIDTSKEYCAIARERTDNMAIENTLF